MNLTEKYMSKVGVRDNLGLNNKRLETNYNTYKSRGVNTIDNSAVKIYSAKLNKELWLVRDLEMQEQMINDGVNLPIFTFADIRKLDGGLSNKALLQIYDVKNVFQGASINLAVSSKY